MKFGILGIPFNGDGTRPEIENPPGALREAGISTLHIRNGDQLFDYGDIDIPVFDGIRDQSTKVLHLEAWKETSRQTAKKIQTIQKEVDFAIILGGDCSILLGIFGAFNLSNRRVGLLSLDGHTDYRDPSSSSTGEPADLELAILTGKGPEALTGMFGSLPLIKASDVVVSGYREPDLIAESKIHHFDCSVFRKTGAENMANRALALLEHLGVSPVPTSYDQLPWKQEAGPTVFAPFEGSTEYFGSKSQNWMINFRVNDLSRMVEQLRKAGVEVSLDEQEQPNGKFARLHDPEGNPIELWEPKG